MVQLVGITEKNAPCKLDGGFPAQMSFPYIITQNLRLNQLPHHAYLGRVRPIYRLKNFSYLQDSQDIGFGEPVTYRQILI